MRQKLYLIHRVAVGLYVLIHVKYIELFLAHSEYLCIIVVLLYLFAIIFTLGTTLILSI